MEQLTHEFKKSLFESSKDTIKEYLEIGIDAIIEKEVLKDIPVVNSIASVLKISKNIYDRNLLKQTLTFINEFNSGDISNEKLNKYKTEINKDIKKCEKELGRVILLLNGYIDKEKSIFLAKIFKKYVEEVITWYEFCEYSEILNRIFITDISVLKDIYEKRIIDYVGSNKFRFERLYAIGVIGWNPRVAFSFAKQEITENVVSINSIGKKFTEIIFEI